MPIFAPIVPVPIRHVYVCIGACRHFTEGLAITSTTAAASSHFQAIFNVALQSYQKQTKKDLVTHPLFSQLQSCDSTSAILAVLQDQVREFDQVRSGDERLTKWLVPTVNVLYAFYAAISEGAAKDVAASKDTLAELFERIGNDKHNYEDNGGALAIFGIATKELRWDRQKLAGKTDLGDAVKRLDNLTQEEARMALAEILRITHSVREEVKVVDGKVESTGDKVEDIDDKVQCIDEKVRVVIDDGKEARVVAKEANLIIQQTADSVDEIKWNQLIQPLRTWLSPPDPFTNHNIARKAQHKGTAVWFFQGSIFIEWESTVSLLWIHGKPGSGKSVICLITVVRNGNSRVVQFSHFSVKEYLTSPRLAQSHGDVSRFHVDLDAAHTILAQACLGTLLRLDERAENSGTKMFPLIEYAAQHWVEHAQLENVSSRVRDGVDDLFDPSKPHFAAWLEVHDMDEEWPYL
ncbi:hypothetical protein EDB87DRAFT_1690943 [Lactarius vividus]|nr:hypothetical protein EDB87DRAFT_1690943 [Lactarius vividus]